MAKARSRYGFLAATAAGLLLGACGRGALYQVPAFPPAPVPVPTGLALNSSAAVPAPAPTPSRPIPPATGSVLIDTLGSGQLVAPRGLAFAAGAIFVADQDHQGLLGTYGAVLRFDPDHGQRQGVYFSRSATESLPPDVTGVGVATVRVGSSEAASLVYPLSGWGVFGFAATTEFTLNLGRPFVPGGQDIAISGADAWVAQSQEVRAFHLPDWLPDVSLAASAIPIAHARGIGIDGQGTVWSVAAGKVYDGTTLFAASGSVPADPRDVAYDPTTGTMLVLDSDRVLRYQPDGTFVAAFGKGALHDPVSVAVGDDGSVYVSDATERRIFRFAPP